MINSENFFLTIIIPCRNEEQYISKCILSIINNNFKNLEIIVADGCSDDKTQEIIKNLQNQYPQIKLLINKDKTTPYGFNLGIENAKGNFIMILGAHSELRNDYIECLLNQFINNPEADCVGGKIENVYQNNTSEIIGKAMSSVFGVGNAYFRVGSKSVWADTVAFGTYKKNVFEKIGLFDTRLVRNQDDEFSYRMIKNGLKIYLDINLNIKYFVRSSYENLFKQYYQYGFWKVLVNKNHKTVTTIRQLIPFIFVLSLLMSLLGAVVYNDLIFVFILILSLWLIVASSFAIKLTKNIYDWVKIIFAFFILHFSYGYGYLVGIIWFLILRNNPKEKHYKITR